MSASLRMLVVEDSPTMRSFLMAALEAVGHEVITAGSGFEALKLLKRDRFQVIISDINMPDVNGLELVRFIRENAQHRETPLLLISTDGGERDRERGIRLGASQYLVKPFTPEQLYAALGRCVKGGVSG